jgi:hypothetical protein
MMVFTLTRAAYTKGDQIWLMRPIGTRITVARNQVHGACRHEQYGPISNGSIPGICKENGKGEKKGIEGGSSEGECTFGGRDMWFGPGVDQCAILSDEVGELEEEMTFELHIGVAV